MAGSQGNCIFIFLGTAILSSIVTTPVYILTNSAVGFLGGTSGKEPACQYKRHKRHRFDPWLGRSPGESPGKWQSTPLFLTEESHIQRSLAG